jgi:uroporphyrinogen-III synthase
MESRRGEGSQREEAHPMGLPEGRTSDPAPQAHGEDAFSHPNFRHSCVTRAARGEASPLHGGEDIDVIAWVIAREPSDGEPLVAALRARGREAICVPLIERRALAWPGELRAAARQEGAIFFLTSPFAARLACGWLAAELPGARLRFAALLPATAAALTAAAHLEADVVAEGGAVALAEALMRSGLEGPVVYPTSDAGLRQAEQREAVQLLERRFVVARAAAYETGPAPGIAAGLARLGGRPYGAVLFSPSAARALAAAVKGGAQAPSRLVAVGASTAEALPFPSEGTSEGTSEGAAAGTSQGARVRSSGEAAAPDWMRASVRAPTGVDLVDFLCSLDPTAPALETAPPATPPETTR